MCKSEISTPYMWGHAGQRPWLAVAPGSVSFRGHGSSSFRPNENPQNDDGTCRKVVRSEARSDDLKSSGAKVRCTLSILAILYSPFLSCTVQHGAAPRHPTLRADWPRLGCFLHTPTAVASDIKLSPRDKGEFGLEQIQKGKLVSSSRGGDIFDRKPRASPALFIHLTTHIPHPTHAVHTRLMVSVMPTSVVSNS